MRDARERIQNYHNVAGGARGIKRIRPNTYRFTDADSSCEVTRFHWTDIFTACPDGTVTLNSGGHRMSTTKDRLNALLSEYGLPYRVGQRQYTWYLHNVQDRGEAPIPFHDGMTVGRGGTESLGDYYGPYYPRDSQSGGRKRPSGLSLDELALWVQNDEGLYNWWQGSRRGLSAFVRENRNELREIIAKRLGR